MINKNRVDIVEELLNDFDTFSLDQLNGLELLNRYDTKFIFKEEQLPLILNKIKPFYKVLEIQDSSLFRYKNTYFDTDELSFYKQHHNMNRNRYKVRFRDYNNSSGNSFFEIKIKNNKNKTVKKRLQIDNTDNSIGEYEEKLISEIIGISSNKLKPALNIQFYRITLVDNSFSERLTIDIKLSVSGKNDNKIFDQLVIAEVKQKKYNSKSNFIKILRKLKITETRFSKYCMGMLHINTNIKYNRFKSKVLEINKILGLDIHRRGKNGFIN